MTSVAKVYAAIAAVQGALAKEGVAKDRNNAQQGYNFRGIDDVYNALAPVLSQNKLCILPRVLDREVTERTTAKGGTLFYVVLEMEFDFVSAEDGSKHTVKVVGEAMDSGDKATNKAMSAAYKYACLQTFCIPTEGDNDADATTHEIERNPKLQKITGAQAEALKVIVTNIGGKAPMLLKLLKVKSFEDLTVQGAIYALEQCKTKPLASEPDNIKAIAALDLELKEVK